MSLLALEWELREDPGIIYNVVAVKVKRIAVEKTAGARMEPPVAMTRRLQHAGTVLLLCGQCPVC